MRLKEEYKVRNIAGENVVIMQGKFGADMTRVIALNDTSLLLWNALKERDFTTEDVANVLLENFDGLDKEVAQNDAAAWIEKLKECKLVNL